MSKFLSSEENRQLIEQLKADVSIVDYGQKLGFSPVRKGSYYSFKEHDSIRIDTYRNIYFRNSRDRHMGSIMDFMIEFDENINNFHDAMCVLTSTYSTYIPKAAPIQEQKRQEPAKKEFILPERDTNVKNVYAYLINTRKIDKSIVSDLMSKGYIKQDIHKNCMFVGYDGKPEDKKPVFACLRGTNTAKPFKGDVPGSDYEKGFYIDNDSNTIVVTESPIDALSYMTFMKMAHDNPYKYNYLSLSSVNKDMSIIERAKNPDIHNVILCLDNDEAGRKAAIRIKDLIKPYCKVHQVIPKSKDINEALCTSPLTIDNTFKEQFDFSISITDDVTHDSDYDLSL